MPGYAYEGPTWAATTVTWSYAAFNLPSDTAAGIAFSSTLSQPAYQAVVQLAMARWEAVAGVTFLQVADSAASDVRVGWGQFYFNGGEVGETDYNYDGSGRTFQPGVDVRFQDPTTDPLNGNSPTTYIYNGYTTSLYQVVLHELGHALGLAHSSDSAAIMYPSAGRSNRELDPNDIAGIQGLYGRGFAGTATIVGADGAPVAVGFDRADGASRAQGLLGGAARLTAVTKGAAAGPLNARSTAFVMTSGTLFASANVAAVVDDAVGAVTLVTSAAFGQSVVAGDGGLTLVANGSGTAVVGGGGNQVFVTAANAGPWQFWLGNGANTVLAATGNDTLAAGTGANLVFLGSGASSVLASGVDTIVGGAGHSSVQGGGNGALVFGGTGGLSFTASSGVNTVVGSAGRLDADGGQGGGLFFGGPMGGNRITAGAGSTTILGGGDGDVLRAAGASGGVIAAGPGAATIDGTGAGGNWTFFAGTGAERIVSGDAATAIAVGTGNDTLVSGAGYSLYVIAAGAAGATETFQGFDPTLDRILLRGYAPDAATTALAGAATGGGTETLTLSDGTHIVFTGMTGATSAWFS